MGAWGGGDVNGKWVNINNYVCFRYHLFLRHYETCRLQTHRRKGVPRPTLTSSLSLTEARRNRNNNATTLSLHPSSYSLPHPHPHLPRLHICLSASLSILAMNTLCFCVWKFLCSIYRFLCIKVHLLIQAYMYINDAPYFYFYSSVD